MEPTLMFVSIVMIVFGVLQIILFFKMWGMTNNVSEMKNILDLMLKKKFQNKKQQPPTSTYTPSISNSINSKRDWSNDATEEDKSKAQSLISSLMKGEVIIKLNKKNRIVVYNENDLYELKNEEYQMIYH